jgi:hypothetical protein
MLTKDFSTAFSTEEECLNYLKELRWPSNQFACPKCGHKKGSWSHHRKVMQCGSCHAQTSITAGSIFHAAKLPITKLLPILVEVISGTTKPAFEIEKEYNIAYSTAWCWLQKIRQFLLNNFCSALDSIEVDCEKIAAVLFRRSSESEPKGTEPSDSKDQEQPNKEVTSSERDNADATVRTITGYVADNFQGVSRKHVQPYVAQFFIAVNHGLFGLEAVLRVFMQSRPATNEMIGVYSSPSLIKLPLVKKPAAQ